MTKEKTITVSSETLYIDKVNYGDVITKKWSSSNNKIAVELFFKSSSDRPNHSIIIASRFNEHNTEPNPPFPGWFLQIVGNKVSLGIGNGKTWKSVRSNKQIVNNQLYHVAFSLDNDTKTAELYLDGEKSVLDNITYKKPCNLVTIGALMANGNYGYKGEIEDIRLGEILIPYQKKEEFNLNNSKQYLNEMKINLKNIDGDISSLKEILNQINNWKIRGLNMDTNLLEKQIEDFENKKSNFINQFTSEYNKLKELDQQIRKSDDIFKESDNVFDSYQLILNNLLEDIEILDKAVENLSEFEELGVKLGSAFESIDQQKNYIKDTIINSEKYLKDNLDESYKIMNIVTLNE